MFIDRSGAQIEPSAMKEIKVKIPVDHHWRLHTLKLTSGVHISEVVRSALTDYFDDVFADGPAGGHDE